MNTTEEHTTTLVQCLQLIASIATESIYLLDIKQKKFCYIKPDNLFLCGYTAEEAMSQGFDFYKRIIHPEDNMLSTEMGKAIMQYLKNPDKEGETIDYFSFTIRLKSILRNRLLTKMVYHRVKPIYEKEEFRYLLCSVASSTRKQAGNLRVYYNKKMSFEEYNFKTKLWADVSEEFLLTEREQSILVLAQQGKNTNEIAVVLCKSVYTIRNQIKLIYKKIGVNSIQEAREFVIQLKSQQISQP